MKNISKWTPSKYQISRGRLMASRDPKQVSPSSRMIADIIAKLYWDHLKRHCCGRLLDLGCGNVPLYEAYRDLIDENICVDWNHTLHGNDYLDFETDLTRPLPLSDESFDTIILSDVLEHLPEPQNIWLEMHRVLKPGGKILLNVPFYYWLHEMPYDYYRFTEFALRRFAEKSGFEVLILKHIGGVLEVLTDIIAKNLVVCGAVGQGAAVAVQAICGLAGRMYLGRKIRDRSSMRFPLGYFMIVRKI